MGLLSLFPSPSSLPSDEALRAAEMGHLLSPGKKEGRERRKKGRGWKAQKFGQEGNGQKGWHTVAKPKNGKGRERKRARLIICAGERRGGGAQGGIPIGRRKLAEAKTEGNGEELN